MVHGIAHDADGRVCAEEAGLNSPRAPASSGLIIDEFPGIVASVERIDAWMAVAKAGDRFVYASRMVLPRVCAGAARMRELAERKLVLLVRPRSTLDPTIFNYTAIRTAVPSALTRPVRDKLSVPSAPLAHDEAAAVNALLPVLERFASKGRPCPTDRQLAERAGLSPDAIAPTLAAMVAGHLIHVQGVRAPTYRRILILSTGAITGLAA
nr:hypothetical protein [uncultured Sphingomonas sp.]